MAVGQMIHPFVGQLAAFQMLFTLGLFKGEFSLLRDVTRWKSKKQPNQCYSDGAVTAAVISERYPGEWFTRTFTGLAEWIPVLNHFYPIVKHAWLRLLFYFSFPGESFLLPYCDHQIKPRHISSPTIINYMSK